MRTWNLRLNLDELNALALSMFSDHERADAFQGMILGCNAGTLPEQCSSIVRKAFEMGLGWRHEAEGYRERKSTAGKASAESRKSTLGTAQPSNTPRTLFEQPPNTPRTLFEQPPNQSTIHNPLTLNDKPTTTAPAGRKRRNKDQVLHGFPPDVQRVVRELYPIWPKEGTEGEPTCATSTQDFSQRVSEIIEAGNDPDILIQAAKEYISIPAKKYAAPQFFFGKTGFGGKGEAKWVGFVKFILTRRENANPTA